MKQVGDIVSDTPLHRIPRSVGVVRWSRSGALGRGCGGGSRRGFKSIRYYAWEVHLMRRSCAPSREAELGRYTHGIPPLTSPSTPKSTVPRASPPKAPPPQQTTYPAHSSIHSAQVSTPGSISSSREIGSYGGSRGKPVISKTTHQLHHCGKLKCLIQLSSIKQLPGNYSATRQGRWSTSQSARVQAH